MLGPAPREDAMPTYDYVCQGCEHRFEHFQSITSDPLQECPQCHQPQLKRLIGTGGALIFKGSGFYCTDYKKSGPGGDKPDEKALDKKVEKAKEAAQATKSEAKSGSSGSGGDTSAA
jgi:putative FmdB family regulatory protein